MGILLMVGVVAQVLLAAIFLTAVVGFVFICLVLAGHALFAKKQFQKKIRRFTKTMPNFHYDAA
jgi:Flp pilus assembly protein TadB